MRHPKSGSTRARLAENPRGCRIFVSRDRQVIRSFGDDPSLAIPAKASRSSSLKSRDRHTPSPRMRSRAIALLRLNSASDSANSAAHAVSKRPRSSRRKAFPHVGSDAERQGGAGFVPAWMIVVACCLGAGRSPCPAMGRPICMRRSRPTGATARSRPPAGGRPLRRAAIDLGAQARHAIAQAAENPPFFVTERINQPPICAPGLSTAAA